MTKFHVYPYKQGSVSAKTLSVTLGGKVLKHVGSKYKPRVGDVVVNWGASNPPNFFPATTLNPDVTVAQCKLASFNAFKASEVSVPQFWTNKGDIPADSFPIVCRTVLRGHSGNGIVVANNPDELVDATLYTKYVKKQDEYRVHLTLGNESFFIQRKARKLDHENTNWQIRNLAGGFSFVEVPEEDVPEPVIDQAITALWSLGLDFGAVDVIWNQKEGKAYVLEINTACGLEERTAERYKQAIADYVENLRL